MQQSNRRFTKRRWFFTAGGMVFYILDICTDVALAQQYFQEKQYVWSGMTVMFVLTAVLVTQIFSCAWYWDDRNTREPIPAIRSKGTIAALHVFGLGIFMRYYYLLKEGFNVNWNTHPNLAERHHRLFCMAADLSMLKLFETFLESAPQLLLQLYIRGHNEWPLLQIFTVAFSFCNMAWSLVDYQHCLRTSLPHVREMPSGLPTAVYLIYKLCTITSLILSYSLFLTLSVYSTVALTVFWLLLSTWVHLLNTSFCSSKYLELLYRAVTGVILIFSFFNTKGKNTKAAMTVYYLCYVVICVSAPLLLAFLKPEMQTTIFLRIVGGIIYVALLVGMLCLGLYYRYLHPNISNAGENDSPSSFDEVDGPTQETATNKRLNAFLQP